MKIFWISRVLINTLFVETDRKWLATPRLVSGRRVRHQFRKSSDRVLINTLSAKTGGFWAILESRVQYE